MSNYAATRFTDKTGPRCQVGENVEVIDWLVPTGFASSEYVDLITLPAGAVVTDAIMTANAGVGGTGNMKLGTDSDDDALISQKNITAAACHRADVMDLLGNKLAAATKIRLTAGTIATPTVGTRVRVILKYSFNIV